MWFHFLFWVSVTVSAGEPLYRNIGDEAVLTPDSVVNPITSITWKHGADIAMEWYGDETYSYRNFKDHGTLNISTGEMTITGLTGDDSGIYTAEINNKVNRKIQLLVISPVPKPSLSVSCDPENTYCVFNCSGNTAGAEPVTYWWTSGDTTWPSTKELKITWEETKQWFICSFKNPVSSNSSEKVLNPFIREPLYRETGDKAVLTPGSVMNPINSIKWIYEDFIAMEWHGGKTYSYRKFKDRGSLNISTGEMTITGLTGDDSRIYTAEINKKVTNKIQLLVISPVPKPSIYVWCDSWSYCVFNCSGNTAGAEPVTYWWTSGDTTWPSTKELKITWKETRLWFTCSLNNPVSSSSSEHVFNPLMRNIIILTTTYGVILVGFFIIYLLWKIDVPCVIIIIAPFGMIGAGCLYMIKGIFQLMFLRGVINWTLLVIFTIVAPGALILVLCSVIPITIIYFIYKCGKALQKKLKRNPTSGVAYGTRNTAGTDNDSQNIESENNCFTFGI